MSRFVYVNGRYKRYGEALVHVEDRGYQFADGVYEVCAVKNGALLDRERHLARLERSLRELRIARPMSDAALILVMQELLRRNRIRDGMVYIQVTRGVARRDHPFPTEAVTPSLVITARPVSLTGYDVKAKRGMAVTSYPDLRWKRCDIKTVGLLANVLAIQAAVDSGAEDAILVDEAGFVTESTRANVWIVDAAGTLVTRNLDALILHGITRQSLLELIAARGLQVEERAFSLEEAKTAREMFITSAVNMVIPVIRLDGEAVGEGVPGPVALDLRAAYKAKTFSEAGQSGRLT